MVNTVNANSHGKLHVNNKKLMQLIIWQLCWFCNFIYTTVLFIGLRKLAMKGNANNESEILSPLGQSSPTVSYVNMSYVFTCCIMLFSKCLFAVIHCSYHCFTYYRRFVCVSIVLQFALKSF